MKTQSVPRRQRCPRRRTRARDRETLQVGDERSTSPGGRRIRSPRAGISCQITPWTPAPRHRRPAPERTRLGSGGSQTLIIPDINLTVYAYDSTSPSHSKAAVGGSHAFPEAFLSGFHGLFLGFVRLWTNARVFSNPMTPDQAASHVRLWLARRGRQNLNPGPRHEELLFRPLRDHGTGGNLINESNRLLGTPACSVHKS